MGQHKSLTDESQRKKNSEKWQTEKAKNKAAMQLKKNAKAEAVKAATKELERLRLLIKSAKQL